MNGLMACVQLVAYFYLFILCLRLYFVFAVLIYDDDDYFDCSLVLLAFD